MTIKTYKNGPTGISPVTSDLSKKQQRNDKETFGGLDTDHDATCL